MNAIAEEINPAATQAPVHHNGSPAVQIPSNILTIDPPGSLPVLDPPVPHPAQRFDLPAGFSPPSSVTLPAGGASASSPQLSTPAPRKHRRNGVIARLRQTERDMVCRMIQNGIPYPKIVHALADHSIYVTERNISNWATRGGYHDWRIQQELAIAIHLDQDNLVKLLRRDACRPTSPVGNHR
jgi:hypothetical protein